jgi:membrane protein
LVTSSIVTGFVHGFILFLAIPVDLGAPFGGLTDIGGGVAIMLWMFVFHVLALAGWLITAEFDRPVGTARTSAG